MTIKELWQKTKSIVDDEFDKVKQDPIFDDEKVRLMLTLSRAKILTQLYDTFINNKQEDDDFLKFVLENSELYFDIVRSIMNLTFLDGDEEQALTTVTNFYDKYLEWKENQE